MYGIVAVFIQEALKEANSRKQDFDSRVLPVFVVKLTKTEKADILG